MTGVTLLQLDTAFPRIPGDVATPKSYAVSLDIIRVTGMGEKQVVKSDPREVDIAPFAEAARRARGDVLVTSCGFLAPFESELSRETDRPFLASSLNALPELTRTVPTAGIHVATFDRDRLTAAHLPPGYWNGLGGIIGLRPGSHLRRVIQEDRTELDETRAQAEITASIAEDMPSDCKLLVLECTNLPPYKHALRQALGVPTYDILDRIEAALPGSIRPEHL